MAGVDQPQARHYDTSIDRVYHCLVLPEQVGSEKLSQKEIKG